SFRRVQTRHWRKLRYWVLAPLALAFIGSLILIWYHPIGSPAWAIWGNLLCQLASHGLTAFMWGPWQAELSRDPAGGKSGSLSRILRTHWIRTLLINAYALKTRQCPLPRAVNTLLSLHDFSKDRSLGPGCCSYDGMQRTSGAPSGLRGAGSISADSATSISAASV